MKRPVAVLVAAFALVGVASPALAGWANSGTGTGQVSARSLNPATDLGTSAGSPSHTAINVTFTTGANPSGTTYVVTRNKQKNGTLVSEVACTVTASPCVDSNLASSTTFTYTIKAVFGNWTKATPGSVSRTTASAPVATPSAPTNVKMTACTWNKGTGDGSVTLTWTPGAGATTQPIYRGTSSTVQNTLADTVGDGTTATKIVTFNIPTSGAGSYYYSVASKNTSGESSKVVADKRAVLSTSGANGSCTATA